MFGELTRLLTITDKSTADTGPIADDIRRRFVIRDIGYKLGLRELITNYDEVDLFTHSDPIHHLERTINTPRFRARFFKDRKWYTK